MAKKKKSKGLRTYRYVCYRHKKKGYVVPVLAWGEHEVTILIPHKVEYRRITKRTLYKNFVPVPAR